MLDALLNRQVVLDLDGPFVCLGTLTRYDDHFLELRDADLHDLRDTRTTRENYVVASRSTGIKSNRGKVLIVRRELVAISLLEDVIDA